jgi:hypothetical protein
MISVKLLAGLGNQLFQIFVCISYAIDNKLEFILPVQNCDNVAVNGDERPTYWENFLQNLTPYIVHNTINFTQWREEHFHYNKIPINLNNVTLCGYFQSYKYFQHNKQQICDLIDIKMSQTKINFKCMNLLKNTNTVSLHFRIGDYKYNSQNHCVLSIDYYINSIQIMLDILETITVIVFSEEKDDSEVTNHIDALTSMFPTVTFLRCIKKLKDWQQLVLMSCCQHNIIANSTFSWWGAYLNNSHRDGVVQRVCYPKTWFGNNLARNRVNDLFPPHWIKVDRIVSVHLMGGLANQLFQIFTCISYALTHNISFILPCIKQDTCSYDGSLRPTYWCNFLFQLNKYVVSKEPSYHQHHEIGHEYTIIPTYSHNFKLNGYFQSFKYFDKNFKEICNIIGISDMKKDLKERYKKYFQDDVTVSLHFRIGDYKNIQHCHPVLKIEYYIEALKYIINKTNISSFTVLYFFETVDTSIVQDHISTLGDIYKDIKFITCDELVCDWEQMLLMSCCTHNIIANSTFSLFGAYFNNNIDRNDTKIAVYPQIWFGQSMNKPVQDMFPSHYHSI